MAAHVMSMKMHGRRKLRRLLRMLWPATTEHREPAFGM
jgi:hypothetical protein